MQAKLPKAAESNEPKRVISGSMSPMSLTPRSVVGRGEGICSVDPDVIASAKPSSPSIDILNSENATMRTILLAVFSLAAILTVSSESLQAAEGLKVGAKAPEFSMKGSDGKTYKLSDMKGKPVVVAWYPKAFTGGCTIECKNFQEKGEVLKKLGIAYFTASVDTAEQNEKFAKSLNCEYPILSDPDKSVATAYGVLNSQRGMAQRWTFYIDKDGVVREIDKKVNTKTAAEDVAATVEKLGLTK